MLFRLIVPAIALLLSTLFSYYVADLTADRVIYYQGKEARHKENSLSFVENYEALVIPKIMVLERLLQKDEPKSEIVRLSKMMIKDLAVKLSQATVQANNQSRINHELYENYQDLKKQNKYLKKESVKRINEIKSFKESHQGLTQTVSIIIETQCRSQIKDSGEKLQDCMKKMMAR